MAADNMEAGLLDNTESKPKEPAKPAGRAPIVNILILSFGMLLVFSSFSTVQNFMSTLKPGDTGTTSVGILYIVFALSNLFAPLVVGKIGLKWSVVGGMLTYVLFVGACIPDEPSGIYLYIAAGIIGVGAAVLWTAHGSYLSESTTESNKGFFMGLFWAIFWCNAILGNLGGALIFQQGLEPYKFYLICVAVAGAGCIVLMFLKPVTGVAKEAQVPPSMMGVVCTMVERTYLPLHVLVMYQALSQSYFYGVLTMNVGYSQWGAPFVGYVMSAAGVAEFIGSLVSGRLSDKFGRRPIFMCAVVLQVISIIIGWWAGPFDGAYNWAPMSFFFAAFIFGVGDAGFVTPIYSTISTLFAHKSKEAFATFKLVQSIAMGAAYLYMVPLEKAKWGHNANVIIISVFLVVGTALSVRSFPTKAQQLALAANKAEEKTPLTKSETESGSQTSGAGTGKRAAASNDILMQ